MLTSLALVFLVGMFMGWIFRSLRLPSLLGMLITGILLGPYCLDLLGSSILSISADLRQLALIIILTRAGLALDIKALTAVGRPAVLMCFVPACFEIGGTILVAPLILGISPLEAAIMGAVVSAVSPAVIVPKMLYLMEAKRGTDKSIPQLIMAGASVDDVFVIVLFGVFTSLAQGGSISVVDFVQIPVSIVLGIIFGLFTGAAMVAFFKKIHLRDSAKVVVMLSVSFLLVAIEHSLRGVVPISGLLAVMTLGGIIKRRNPDLAGRLSSKFSKLWVAAEVLLFVLVGATVDVGYALAAGGAAVAVIALALVFRTGGVWTSLLGTPLSTSERFFSVVAYMPKATVQAAIGSIPLTMGLACGPIVLTVAVLSILITAPLGAMGIDYLGKRVLQIEE